MPTVTQTPSPGQIQTNNTPEPTLNLAYNTPTTSSNAISNAISTVNTTPTFVDSLSSNQYLNLFFNSPWDSRMGLYIPGYAYFQGIIYSQGNITAAGPVRIIGGVVANSLNTSPHGKKILIEKGAMLTADPDYLLKQVQRSNNFLRVVEWKEITPPKIGE